MITFTEWGIATCIALTIVGVAYAARAGVRRQTGAPAHLPAKLSTLLSMFVPALMVLLLSLPIFVASQLDVAASLTGFEKYLRAWLAFWSLVLLIDGSEFVLRLFYALKNRSFPLPKLIRNILHFMLLLGAVLLVAKTVLGRDISTALASTALLTAVVGFALQSVLSNVLAGMSLDIVRFTAPGDWVAVGDLEGEVLETNWRETRLRTVGGHMLVVPNSKFADSIIHNMTQPTSLRRIRISVGASYSDAPAEVMAALETAALSIPEVVRDPKPTAVLTEYKDFGINYDLRFWTTRYFDRSRIISDVQSRIWYEFKRHGIEIPFPMSDQLLNDFMEVVYTQRTLPPEDKKVDRTVADLMQSDFCRKLLCDAEGQPLITDSELRTMAHSLRRLKYTNGEIFFRQGDAGESAYILISGTIQGEVAYQADVAPHTFDLAGGALFGEMSLMTGLPRTATLKAANEVEVLEISHAAFVQILGFRPEIPAKLAELVAQRAAQNATMYEKLKAIPKADLSTLLQRDSILQRFKRLLKL